MSNKVEFKKIREFGEVINDTVLFIKQNFRSLMKTFIYLCGIFIVVSTIASVMQQISAQDLFKGVNAKGSPIFNHFSQMFTVNTLIALIFMFVSYTAMGVAIQSYITLYVENGNVAPSVAQVWPYFKYYYFRMLGSTVVLSLFFVLCLALCVAPGIYVFPALSLFSAVMITENADFSYSFSRSFKLLKDQWWATLATLVVIWIITYACTFLVSLPALVMTMASAFTNGGKGLSTGIIVFTSISQHIAQVFLIIPIIGASLCYFNLVERQENSGLLGRINQLGTTAETDLNTSKEEY